MANGTDRTRDLNKDELGKQLGIFLGPEAVEALESLRAKHPDKAVADIVGAALIFVDRNIDMSEPEDEPQAEPETPEATGGEAGSGDEELDPDEKAVKVISALHDKGMPMSEIAQRLEDEGVPPLSGEDGWNAQSVARAVGAEREKEEQGAAQEPASGQTAEPQEPSGAEASAEEAQPPAGEAEEPAEEPEEPAQEAKQAEEQAKEQGEEKS